MSTPPDDLDADHALAGYDLHAWQPPPAPTGIAEAVIARMQPTARAPVPPRTSARTLLTVAIATLVAVAAITVMVVTHGGSGANRAPAPPSTALAPVPPPPAPGPPLPAGGPSVDAERVRVLEERVAELEARLAKLDEARRTSRPHPVDTDVEPVIPPPAPHPRHPPPAPSPEPPSPPPRPDPLDSPFTPMTPAAPASPPAPPPCDADALAAAGTALTTKGAHTAALERYEAALRCRPGDAHLVDLAYMASCSAPDAARAHLYYGRMSEPRRTQLLQLCIRNHIDPRVEPAPEPGVLAVASTPAARIFIDGTDTGKSTPLTLSLAPGKHKLTFAIASDEGGLNRYTYPITVRAGEKTAITKNFQ